MQPELSLVNTTKKRVAASVLQRPFQMALKHFGTKHIGLVSVVLIGDARMRKLNSAYRGKDKTTDVLSFSSLDNPPRKLPHPIEGDIIISVPVALRQAKQVGHSFSDELRRLFVHGIVHLAGYDHMTDKEEKRMRAIEDFILELL